jgi:hypothetical protein
MIGVASAVLTPSASAETSPGPAFVDELSSQLQPLRDDGRGDLADARAAGLGVADGKVLVDVYLTSDPVAAARDLEALGMEISATAREPRPVVEGLLPLDSLVAASKLADAEAVIAPLPAEVDVGSVTSQGVGAHNIPAAAEIGAGDGASVDVGVISDSIDQVDGGVAASQATGDLPGATIVLKDDPVEPTDEGRAMAEIVYDEAPGLNSILFASGTIGGPVGKADSINQLVANGADVITDDIVHFGEPFFQDGVIAQAVDNAKAAGVAYFASAGNRARQSYESTYRDNGGLHDFDPGPGVDTSSCFDKPVPPEDTLPPGLNPPGELTIVLDWDEPVGNVTTDIDLRMTDGMGNELDISNANSPAIGDPKEFVTYRNDGPTPVTPCIEIRRSSGSRSPFVKWIQLDNYAAGIPQFNTASDTINPDAASARGAIAVAAMNYADFGLNTPESFSSRGPKTRFFDAAGNRFATPLILNKPELTAADRVSTSVPGFTAFAGTSAASPSAAGIATILRSTNPKATVNHIYSVMTDPLNAITCTSANPLQDCGAGFILADRAVSSLDRTPIKPTLITRPGKPDGRGKWFTKKKVKVSWDTSDPDSPTESTAGCGPRIVRKQGTTKIKCKAVSGGGPGSATAKIKHDTKKPKAPKVKGIKNGDTYRASQLPSAKKVKKCKSKDKTSGLKSCKVKGFSTKPGKHKLKATATDKAGLKSKKTVSYEVK